TTCITIMSIDENNCTSNAQLLLGCKNDNKNIGNNNNNNNNNNNSKAQKNDGSITKKNHHHHDIHHTAITPHATSSIVQVSPHENNISKSTSYLTTTTTATTIPQLKLVAREEKKVVVEEKNLLQEIAKQQQQQQPGEEFITTNKPIDADVLCGRGGKVNKHPGNIVYRKVVDYNKTYYQSVHKKHRILVSKSIVQAILNNGGRFMGQKSSSCGGEDEWIPINFKRAVQKTSQALRERSNTSSISSDDGKQQQEQQVVVGEHIVQHQAEIQTKC
ncbi:MAG: hypothetical protein ACI90V_009563, partial [Bacillariaceae sp.]